MQQGLRTLSCLCGRKFGFREHKHVCACMYYTWNLDPGSTENDALTIRRPDLMSFYLVVSYVLGLENFSCSCEATSVVDQGKGE